MCTSVISIVKVLKNLKLTDVLDYYLLMTAKEIEHSKFGLELITCHFCRKERVFSVDFHNNGWCCRNCKKRGKPLDLIRLTEYSDVDKPDDLTMAAVFAVKTIMKRSLNEFHL